MKLKRLLFFATAVALSIGTLSAATIRGKVLDKITGEPLLGATVMVKGTTVGTATGFDGSFEITAQAEQELVFSYISYLSQEIKSGLGVDNLEVRLVPDTQMLASVEVVTRANLETEANLQNERMASKVAIENLGVKEMSIKGLSNAEDGVKKMTGISIADAGEVFVRGLGDRYSLTTMNGVPVASPNPDNKLIPLDVFPSSAIQNITVSKVYRVDAFADYSGALIDIATKNLVSKNFFNISASVGLNTETTGQDFYVGDRGSLFSTPKVPSEIDGLRGADFQNYMSSTTDDPFGYGFSADKKSALPDLTAQLGFGHKWRFDNDNELNLLLSGSIDNGRSTVNDGYIKTIDKYGRMIDEFTFDSYKTTLDMSALTALGYTFGENTIGYNLFYARNVEDTFKYREGRCEEGDDIIGTNKVQHIYKLLTHQLNGEHELNDRWSLDWVGAYSVTSSDEPDRRQMLFYPENRDGFYNPYSLDQQSTNRYYGDLTEVEFSGDLSFDYKFAEDGLLNFGGAYRDKDRDYASSMYTYQYKNGGVNGTYDPDIESVYNPDPFINQEHFANGDIGAGLYDPASSDYFATSYVAAGYVSATYSWERLMLDLGVRYENSTQWVKSWADAAPLSEPTISELNSSDIFPALNLKYNLSKENSLRFSASKTVTRPSFVEMAPFKYRESYSASYVRGNGDLKNGYNYNFDLRYDFFKDKSSDMFSICGYYKFLDNPIERVQELEGGSTVYSFMNSNSGFAAGVELEYRRMITENLRFGVNGSYMLTHVVLDEGGGVYTDNERQLQGASPYLANVDLSYTLRPRKESTLTMTLLYALQGPRIDAVGVYGLENVIQQEIQELNFVCSYALNNKLSLSLKLENLLNYPTILMQEANSGKNYEVGRYNTGIDGSIGISYKF